MNDSTREAIEVVRRTVNPPVRCANARCRANLVDNPDTVVMVTTAHVRHFCGVDCIAEGHAVRVLTLLASER